MTPNDSTDATRSQCCVWRWNRTLYIAPPLALLHPARRPSLRRWEDAIETSQAEIAAFARAIGCHRVLWSVARSPRDSPEFVWRIINSSSDPEIRRKSC
ncbi:hypothetical protein [Baaleninema simplex]|uniref:hypothetical protein n=1 Tax=Baaleninema simplex TaxID=2862350 RepID=UPI00034660CD|nr:hypothetical protein [Baaleninema simplex]